MYVRLFTLRFRSGNEVLVGKIPFSRFAIFAAKIAKREKGIFRKRSLKKDIQMYKLPL